MTTFFLQVLCVNCICARRCRPTNTRRSSRLHCRGRVCRDIPSSTTTTTTTTSNQYYIGITIKNVVLNGIIFATSSEPLKEMLTMNGRRGVVDLCHLPPHDPSPSLPNPWILKIIATKLQEMRMRHNMPPRSDLSHKTFLRICDT